MKELSPLEKEMIELFIGRDGLQVDPVFHPAARQWAKAAAALCQRKMEVAFLAGRSKQSWDSFLSESKLHLLRTKCICEPNEKHGETSFMCCNHCGLPVDLTKEHDYFKEKIKRAIELAREKKDLTPNGESPHYVSKYTEQQILELIKQNK